MPADPATPLRLTVEPDAVTLQPGQPPAVLDVRVANLSPIVDEFVVWVDCHGHWLDAGSAEVRVMPHAEGETQIELTIPPDVPVEAGTRPIDVRVRSNATGTVEVAPVELTVPVVAGDIELSIEPSVVRDTRGGTVELVLRNGGNAPAVLSLHASDPEDEIRFDLTVNHVDVPPRGEARAALQLSAARPVRTEERHRTFNVEARGGPHPLQASGQFIQPGALPDGRIRTARVLVRAGLTVLGGLLVLLGAFRAWNTGGALGPSRSGLGWNYVALADLFDPGAVRTIVQSGALPLLSAGALVVLLAAGIVVGLTGRAGRLTRSCAGLAVLLVVAFTVVVTVAGGHGGPATGVWLIVLGGVAAFVGGLLAER